MLNVNIEFVRSNFQLDARFSSDALVTGLFGPSGTGKSTLLHLIAGLCTPKEGIISVADEVLYCSKSRINMPAHQRRIALVFQDAQLFPHLSVKSNLLYGYRLLKSNQQRFQLDTIINLLEVGSLLDKKPYALSGGEKQRVGLGRALLSSPRLLLLDEPLASLDERLKQQILPFLLRTRDELGLPMLYVSHSIKEINYLTDHVVSIDRDFAGLSSVINLAEKRIPLKVAV
jgi:molybdate transport system ATP-binding protein